MSEIDAETAINTPKSEHQIKQLDIVIVNAGVARYDDKTGVLPLSEAIEATNSAKKWYELALDFSFQHN